MDCDEKFNALMGGKDLPGLHRHEPQMRMKKSDVPLYTTMALGLLMLAGCSRTDFSTEVKDARGVTKQSPVMHYDNRVGQVDKIVPTGTGFRLDVRLDKPYRNTFRADLKACPVHKTRTTGQPALVLIGGGGASAPLLKRGMAVPEASLAEVHVETVRKFSLKYLGALGSILALLIIALKLLKGLLKFAVMAVLVAALVYGVHLYRNDMLMEKINSIKSEEAIKWLKDNKEWIEGTASTIMNIEVLKEAL